MATYEDDPDVIRWGLNLLNGYFPTLSGCETTHTPSIITEYHCAPYYATAEFTDCSVPNVVIPSAPPYSHDWNCGTVNDSYRDVDIMGSSSSGYYSSTPEDGYSGPADQAWDLQITDDTSFDGEVGKRLNQMVPIAHVPKINGEIPSLDEATSDHQRLIDRLQLYELIELKVKGDGNCQFRALSDQIYRSCDHHKFVREQILKQLRANPEMYEGYVPMPYSEYLAKLSSDGEWGDHVTLQAAADSYGVKIFVITSFKDTCYIEILPKVEKSKRVVCLSFWAEVHYNSIYPEGELPSPEAKKKRSWWKF